MNSRGQNDANSLEAEVSRVFVKPPQAAVHRRRCAKHHILAQIVTSRLAKLAYPAGHAGFDGNAIADLDAKTRNIINKNNINVENKFFDINSISIFRENKEATSYLQK